MKRFILFSGLLVWVCLMLSCNKNNPTTPSSPTPNPPTITDVTVTSEHSTVVVGNTEQMTATVTMSDGTTKAGNGTWSSANPNMAIVNQSGLVTGIRKGSANIIFDNTAGGRGSKTLTIRDIWKKSGKGDMVFDMPTYVERVRIIGTYTGYSSNFIVWVGGDLLVNELLGTGWGQTRYDGTHLTTGGIVVIEYSSGVSWSFEEKSPKNTMIDFLIPHIWHQSIPNGEREFEIYKRTSEGKR
jgi:hypothetical protein